MSGNLVAKGEITDFDTGTVGNQPLAAGMSNTHAFLDGVTVVAGTTYQVYIAVIDDNGNASAVFGETDS